MAAIDVRSATFRRSQFDRGHFMGGLTRIHVQNYRALADVELEVGPINLVFGPNGAGKSTLLDSLYFFRDCAIRGVDTASSERDHGIGILWDGAVEKSRITVELEYGDESLQFRRPRGLAIHSL